ncbi:MAG: geranylgeranyl reductase family protein [Acidobacteria bacterium]|nr:MAG: geranylgeranyl reductase family protein [Acidobacteriota bacterium]
MDSPGVDVVVAGAGPAGSMAARMLARAGLRVVLCDKATFPRDKTCGDALIPDSIAALRFAGAWDGVAERARALDLLEVLSPRGIAVPIRGEYRVVRRRVFDEVLFNGALQAGAEFRQASVKRPIEDPAGHVAGIVVERSGREEEIRAPLTVLATGAEGAILKKFDASARTTASGYAIRTYAVHASPGRASDRLFISLERDLLPGYAWAFPGPENIFNIGVFWASARRGRRLNLRAALDRLMSGNGNLGEMLGPMKPTSLGDGYAGAMLRTGLTGSSLGRRGLAIIGDAAGTTYSISGEGIGKAMESGLVVAELAVGSRDLPQVGCLYKAEMQQRYARRFRAYRSAERWMRLSILADLVAYRANRSPTILRHLTSVVTEDSLSGDVFSLKGFWALLTR